MASLTDVMCVQILEFSCTPEAGKTIAEMASSLDLNYVVLAACACCSLDQVCYSCTYQRVRCKQNLGLFYPPGSAQQPPDFTAAENSRPIITEFVNIREQCAWVHANDPPAATSKAAALITAVVAKMRIASSKFLEPPLIERSVLIVGSSAAAQVALDSTRSNVATLGMVFVFVLYPLGYAGLLLNRFFRNPKPLYNTWMEAGDVIRRLRTRV